MTKFIYSTYYNGKLWKFSSENKTLLMSDVVKFMRENNIIFSTEDLSKAIDRQSRILEAPKKISLQDAVTGAMALLRYSTGKSVTDAELVRRSNICAVCPLRNTISTCASCGSAGRITNWINKIRSLAKIQIQIPSEVRQSYCGVCNCALALMVVTDINGFAESDDKNRTRPDLCWLKKTSINYKQ